MEPTVCFVSASHQNVFFAEMMDAFAEALAQKGIAVERAVDFFPELGDRTVYVFVPHELLPLIMPDAQPTQAQLRRSITICTEQPGTAWFDADVSVAEKAAAAIDINSLSLAAMRKKGIDARLLQLGYVPSWDYWHGDALSERPVALTFQGSATPRRLLAVARCGRVLASHRSEIHLFDSALPHQADSQHFLSGERKWTLLTRTQILLNVHRSELGYLEWQRAVGAITNGCVFLTEHSLGFEPLIPGEHFVSASFDNLDVVLNNLLEDPDRLTRMRTAGYELLRDGHPLSASIEVLAETARTVARRPILGPRRHRRVGPRPLPPPPPLPEYDRLALKETELSALRMAVKQILLDQREVRRAVQDLRSAIGDGSAGEEDAVEQLGPRRAKAPRVSVVLTVYNYASVVGAAIESVSLSEFADYELVIVDDASTDGSGAAIRAAVARSPWVATTLITRGRNGGLPRARNLGATFAAADLLFILDADNVIYPHALGRLVAALDEMPEATFAYGIIEKFALDGTTGLTSYLGWDAALLRYGNYVDAMAMLRRAALLEVGGYTTDPRLYGWEDFALWCAFADRGWRGVRVPEIVARYRLSLQSMISLTNIDVTAAWSVLVGRFSCLSARDASGRAVAP